MAVDRSQGRLRSLFEAAGALWLDLPVLHPADPFLETAGEDIRRRMFVTEGPTGERLALRPDFTIPVCLAHLASGAAAGRYAYEGTVFRRHDSGSPERLETGYEDIGRDARTVAEAEALGLAVAGVAAIAGGSLFVRIGDIGLFTALLNALGLPGRWRRRLRRSFGLPAIMEANLGRLAAPGGPAEARLDPAIRAAVEEGNREAILALLSERAAVQGFGDGAGRSPAEIADRLLDKRALPDIARAAPAVDTLRAFLALDADLAAAPAMLRAFATGRGVDLDAALEAFTERAEAIGRIGTAAEIRFEAGFGRPLDYYSGLVFEIRADGMPLPVAGGGRYDRLMEMLGAPRPVPAVGFTIRLDGARDEGR